MSRGQLMTVAGPTKHRVETPHSISARVPCGVLNIIKTVLYVHLYAIK